MYNEEDTAELCASHTHAGVVPVQSLFAKRTSFLPQSKNLHVRTQIKEAIPAHCLWQIDGWWLFQQKKHFLLVISFGKKYWEGNLEIIFNQSVAKELKWVFMKYVRAQSSAKQEQLT